MEHSPTAAVPINDALARDRAVTKSLAGRRDYLLTGMSLLLGMVVSARLCFPERLGWPIDYHLGANAQLFALPIAMFPLVLTLILIGGVVTPWRRGLELRWLSALPFPFAHQGYLMALKRESSIKGPLQLLLTFAHVPLQEDVAQLFRLRLPGVKLVWQDEQCVMIASPEGTPHLHRWFRRVAAPFLVTLHRDGGLKKVELRT